LEIHRIMSGTISQPPPGLTPTAPPPAQPPGGDGATPSDANYGNGTPDSYYYFMYHDKSGDWYEGYTYDNAGKY
jgi:hypothetical protein